jgi:hypothetical protein
MSTRWTGRRVFFNVLHSRVIAFVAGAVATAAVEAWFRSDWKTFGFAGAVLLLGTTAYSYWAIRREDRFMANETAAAREIMRPKPEAEALAKQPDHRVVGDVVELLTRRNLAASVTINDKGWAPSQVVFTKAGEKRNFDLIVAQVGGLDKTLVPPNGKKFGIARFSAVTNDSDEQPEFEFYETDYYTQQSVYRVLPDNYELRNRFGSLDPSVNRVPNALSLQAVVLFPNHEILCMFRRRGVDAQQARWSFSFEEQLKDVDFEQMPICSAPEFLFRRAFVEEVYGCKSDSIVNIREAWQSIENDHVVDTYRLLGLFYEVPVAHFQLLGVYRLNVTPSDLDSHHSLMKGRAWAGPDPEGTLFILERKEWERLLAFGYGTASGLYGGSKRDHPLVRIEELHWTSLYRLWRVAKLLGYTAPSTFGQHFTTLDLGGGASQPIAS